MPLVRLVSFDAESARVHARDLKKAGFEVDASPFKHTRLIGQFRDRPPAAILIDLDRLPSHGRAVAVVVRSAKSTCRIPIVFAGGEESKVERAREQVHGAFFTDWRGVAGALKKALQNRPAIISPRKAYMQQYAGSSLVKKLDVKANMRVSLLAAPEGFEDQLGELPAGVELESRLTAQTRMAIWFVRARRELESEIDFLALRLPDKAPLWIVYPKQTSRFKVDFNQRDVRATALAAGLVDYKICAVDSDWTGLKFSRKKS
jgi:hypothetical protein